MTAEAFSESLSHRGPLRVLLVEDDPTDARSVAALLKAVDSQLTVAATLSEAVDVLRSGSPDVVLLDLRLPDAIGAESVGDIRAHAPRVPIVVLTGFDDRSLALQCIAAGAQDFLLKRELRASMLLRAIDLAAARLAETSARTESEVWLSRLATILDASTDAVISMTPFGLVTSWNRGAETIFGYGKSEAVGRSIGELLRTADDHSVEDRLRELRTGRAFPGAYETVRFNRWGEPVTLSVVNTVLRDHAGEAVAIATVARDVTALRAREDELISMNRALIVRDEQLRALAMRMIAVREEERVRIAREVHDELGQLLTGIKLHLGMIRRRATGDGAVAAQIAEAETLVDRTIESVQRITVELRPAALDALGLGAAIRDEARRFEQNTGIMVLVEVGPDPRASKAAETALFRIFQELLTNVVRHARATMVRISLQAEGPDLVLRVEDNGVGLPAAAIGDSRSIGLLGMRERANVVGGTIEFLAFPRGGTQVVVRVPFGQ